MHNLLVGVVYPIYINHRWLILLDNSSENSNLHDEHVLYPLSLFGEITHVSYQSSLSTASLSHDNNWNVTSIALENSEMVT